MNESSYLARTIEVLYRKIKEIDEKMTDSQKDMKHIHEYFWENYTEFDEYGYEMYDNSRELKNRMQEQEEYKKDRVRYEKMLDSPYFGRVDFRYEGEDLPETYYIGIGNLSEGRAEDPYVFDWRAPVSGLFYDFDKGPAEFAAPAGVLRGEITRKKQYKIKNGRIVFVLENDMNIDDEILQQTLSEHTSAALKSIVTTIQKEQNRMIRDQRHRILAVQGCAGSGKTSVALHRIAYLLYHNRKNLHAAQILILSPNGIFADYISRILPELGEENIREMTLDHFAYHMLSEFGEAEDRYDEIEKMLHTEQRDAGFPVRLKKSYTHESVYKQTKEYMEELEGFILSLEWELMDFKDFRYKTMELKESRITSLFYEKLADAPILSRMEKIGEYLIDEEETIRGKNMAEEEKQEIFDRLNRMYETRNLIEIYNRFLKSSKRELLDCSDGILRYEDVYPLLYLKFSLSEFPRQREVRHLVMDEMQDYSYLQFSLLRKMFDCPMTILGDKVQTLAEERQDVLSFLPKIFGKEVHCIYLDKSYRSTVEITEFAAKIAGEAVDGAVERHGEEPQIRNFADRGEMFDKIAADFAERSEYDTAGVLCLDAESAKETAEELVKRAGGQEVLLLTKDSVKFKRGISVMPFYLAKGLEFDAVYVPDIQRYVTPLHRQALYINVTRALHALRLYAVKNEKQRS